MQQHRGSGAVAAGTTQTEGGCRKHYIHYSLGHSTAQPLPGLHPGKPLNSIKKKTVIKIRCNSLTSDCPEKFILMLQSYICNQVSCSEGKQDALRSCRNCRAQRDRRHKCPQLLKSSRSTNSSSFHCHVDKSFSAHTTAEYIFSPSLPFKLFL